MTKTFKPLVLVVIVCAAMGGAYYYGSVERSAKKEEAPAPELATTKKPPAASSLPALEEPDERDFPAAVPGQPDNTSERIRERLARKAKIKMGEAPSEDYERLLEQGKFKELAERAGVDPSQMSVQDLAEYTRRRKERRSRPPRRETAERISPMQPINPYTSENLARSLENRRGSSRPQTAEEMAARRQKNAASYLSAVQQSAEQAGIAETAPRPDSEAAAPLSNVENPYEALRDPENIKNLMDLDGDGEVTEEEIAEHDRAKFELYLEQAAASEAAAR